MFCPGNCAHFFNFPPQIYLSFIYKMQCRRKMSDFLVLSHRGAIHYIFFLQLQQERRKMAAELEELKRERDGGNKQVEQLKKEVSSLRSTLEETEWGLCQKSG